MTFLNGTRSDHVQSHKPNGKFATKLTTHDNICYVKYETIRRKPLPYPTVNQQITTMHAQARSNVTERLQDALPSINERSFTNNLVKDYPLLCILFQNTALNAFKALMLSEITILTYLSLYPKGLPYRFLQRSITRDCNTISNNSFHPRLKSLTAQHYIARERIGNKVFYSITAEGRVLLYQFAAQLEKIVQQKLKEFGQE